MPKIQSWLQCYWPRNMPSLLFRIAAILAIIPANCRGKNFEKRGQTEGLPSLPSMNEVLPNQIGKTLTFRDCFGSSPKTGKIIERNSYSSLIDVNGKLFTVADCLVANEAAQGKEKATSSNCLLFEAGLRCRVPDSNLTSRT